MSEGGVKKVVGGAANPGVANRGQIYDCWSKWKERSVL